jgi:hypothetical protein
MAAVPSGPRRNRPVSSAAGTSGVRRISSSGTVSGSALCAGIESASRRTTTLRSTARSVSPSSVDRVAGPLATPCSIQPAPSTPMCQVSSPPAPAWISGPQVPRWVAHPVPSAPYARTMRCAVSGQIGVPGSAASTLRVSWPAGFCRCTVVGRPPAGSSAHTRVPGGRTSRIVPRSSSPPVSGPEPPTGPEPNGPEPPTGPEAPGPEVPGAPEEPGRTPSAIAPHRPGVSATTGDLLLQRSGTLDSHMSQRAPVPSNEPCVTWLRAQIARSSVLR